MSLFPKIAEADAISHLTTNGVLRFAVRCGPCESGELAVHHAPIDVHGDPAIQAGRYVLRELEGVLSYLAPEICGNFPYNACESTWWYTLHGAEVHTGDNGIPYGKYILQKVDAEQFWIRAEKHGVKEYTKTDVYALGVVNLLVDVTCHSGRRWGAMLHRKMRRKKVDEIRQKLLWRIGNLSYVRDLPKFRSNLFRAHVYETGLRRVIDATRWCDLSEVFCFPGHMVTIVEEINTDPQNSNVDNSRIVFVVFHRGEKASVFKPI